MDHVDIAAFYDADERRRTSDELVFGSGWSTTSDPGAAYKAGWIHDTRELYTVREPHHGGLLSPYLEQAHLDAADTSEYLVEILLVAEQAQVETVLMGWADHVEGENSLDWLHRQVRPSA